MYLEEYKRWLAADLEDADLNPELARIEGNDEEIKDRFAVSLKFGTAGLRGVLGAGTNRMNIYVVRQATQGLANWVKTQGGNQTVAISYDSRLKSDVFAKTAAGVLAANGIKVRIYDALMPVPALSFATRYYNCNAGIMVTASHNPAKYNGYKAYWSDGSQVTAPHDKNIIDEVEKITEVDQVLTGRNPQNIHALGKDFDELYLNKIYELSLSSESVKRFHDMKIVYSPMHGAGVRLVPASLKKFESLKRFGFTNVQMVPEQAVIDGNFPTVESPNPEERKTMSMAIDLAKKVKADLVLATDPDSDRIGVALPDENGEYVLLNGNQTLVLLMTYQLTRWAELGRLNGHQYVIKTIVTTEMVDAVADYFKVKCYECLTGFKYIAKIIRGHEGTDMQYIGGGEESFGYLAGDYVRDKDGVSACSLAAEAAAWVRDTMGISLYEWLKQLYVKYGFYQEGLVSVVRTGKEGAELIQRMMVDYRANPPKEILGSLVVKINDIQTLESFDVRTGKKTHLEQDKSNVLQWYTEDGTRVCVRPSGTEPKIKFYFGVKATLPSVADYEKVRAELNDKIERIKKELKLV